MGSELGGPEMYPYEKPRRLPKAQVICFKGHPLKQRMEPFISIGNMYTCIIGIDSATTLLAHCQKSTVFVSNKCALPNQRCILRRSLSKNRR